MTDLTFTPDGVLVPGDAVTAVALAGDSTLAAAFLLAVLVLLHVARDRVEGD